MKLLLAIALVSACGSDKSSPPEPAHGSGAAGSGSAHVIAIDAGPTVPLGPDGVPKVCADWKAAIDKLQTCTALPQNARESLEAVYKDASAGWGQLPADAKLRLVTICRAGTDAVLQGAAATCGW